jgi:hypothetical protein
MLTVQTEHFFRLLYPALPCLFLIILSISTQTLQYHLNIIYQHLPLPLEIHQQYSFSLFFYAVKHIQFKQLYFEGEADTRGRMIP